jgi:hypothetical protein
VVSFGRCTKLKGAAMTVLGQPEDWPSPKVPVQVRTAGRQAVWPVTVSVRGRTAGGPRGLQPVMLVVTV